MIPRESLEKALYGAAAAVLAGWAVGIGLFPEPPRKTLPVNVRDVQTPEALDQLYSDGRANWAMRAPPHRRITSPRILAHAPRRVERRPIEVAYTAPSDDETEVRSDPEAREAPWSAVAYSAADRAPPQFRRRAEQSSPVVYYYRPDRPPERQVRRRVWNPRWDEPPPPAWSAYEAPPY